MKIQSISIMPYCHADWAWNYYRAWHVKRYIKSFEIALDLMDQNSDFTWFIDTWTDQFRVVIENRPDLVERMKPYVSEGRFGIAGGLYSNPHPDRAGREAYVRNAVYGRRLFLDIFPDADLTAVTHEDVIMGHTQLPQVLTKLGFTFYTSSRSCAAMAAKGVPTQFLWTGLDGTKLITERSHYGELRGDLIPADFRDKWDEARKPFLAWAETKTANGSSPHLCARQGSGDDCLPLRTHADKPDRMLDFLDEWRKREKIALEFSTPARFARKLAKAKDLPAWEGPLDPVGWSYWYGGNGNYSLWPLRLVAEKKLTQLERALIHFGKEKYPQAEMEELWRQALSVWSHATLWLWIPDYEEFLVRIKNVIQQADARLEQVRRDAAKTIAPRQDGRPVVLFNPLPWERKETVEIYYPIDEAGPVGIEIVDSNGGVVPTQVCSDSFWDFPEGKLRECLINASVVVPASGFATYYVRHSTEPMNRATQFLQWPKEIAASSVHARIEQGKLLDVRLMDLNRVLCGSVDFLFEEIDEGGMERSQNLGHYFGPGANAPPREPWSHLHYGKVVGRSFYVGRRWVIAEDGPLAVRMTSLGETAGNETEWELKFYRNRPRIDVRLRVYVTQAKSGFFLASVNLPFEGKIHADIPWGVEERNMTKEPFGMALLERKDFPAFYGNSWVDVSDGAAGVAVLDEDGQQGYRIRDGRLEHFLLKTIAPENIRGRRWSNQHRTGLGFQEFRFAILLHRGDWRTARLYREVEEYRQPIAARDVNVRLAGRGADRVEGVMVSPENVMLSGLYREGGKTILRIYENEGRRTKATVSLPFKVKKVRRTNLIGETEKSAQRPSLRKGCLSVVLSPWEIVTFELT
ncbi:MAG: glycosyl hydrolase-related protein [Planctomycetota bacterium]